MAEEEFRRLQAELEAYADPEHKPVAKAEITVCGKTFQLRPDGGLIPLLRYMGRASNQPEGEHARGQWSMAAMHQLLEECVTPRQWSAFEHHCTAAKAGLEDIEPAIQTAISVYTGRPYWAGMRLLATVCDRLAELDGQVLQGTGRSLATFSAREVCNLMLTMLLTGKDDEERQFFLEDLYLPYSPEQAALDNVLKMIESKKAAEAQEEEPDARPAESPRSDTGPADPAA